jgi:hypothetical protein
MDTDELKRAWQCFGDDDGTPLPPPRIRDDPFARLASTRRWLVLGQFVQIGIWIAVLVWLPRFALAHRESWPLLGSALAIHVYGIVTVLASVLQLLLVARLDPARPVLLLQKRLLQLHALRVRMKVWLILPWWLLWPAGFAVGVMAWSGRDLYATAPEFMTALFALGIAGLVATVLVARRVVERARAQGRQPGFANDLGGHGLRRAAAAMHELQRFERD